MSRLGLFMSGAALFCVLATFNAAGYRYGVSDQAFYVPAIFLSVDPSLYPHDSSLIRAQADLIVFDELGAILSHATGWSLPTLFFVGYLASLLLLLATAAALGRTLYRSWWTVAALGFALTLRHRITDTAVNTLEGYLHPRMLAFAIGVGALLAFVRGRSWTALALAAAAGFFHPTIALWFVVWIASGIFVSDARARRPLLACAAVASMVAFWALSWGPLHDRLVRMDDAWLAVLAGKDYLFPTAWPWYAWILNLGYLIAIVAIYRYRRRVAAVSPREAGLVAGCAALFLIFLVSLPLTSTRLALAVQLQTSRVFWMFDLLATIYVVWLLAESPIYTRWPISSLRARRAAVAVIAAAAFARGGYVMFVEQAERSPFEIEPPTTEWTEVMDWAARTPPGTNLLADPGHAWRYGRSVRVASQRDVYLEEVKDTAFSIYSGRVARRVFQRIQDLGDFQQLTPAHARALAVKYDLHYLISERPIDLPVAYRNGRFSVYTLGEPASAVSGEHPITEH